MQESVPEARRIKASRPVTYSRNRVFATRSMQTSMPETRRIKAIG